MRRKISKKEKIVIILLTPFCVFSIVYWSYLLIDHLVWRYKANDICEKDKIPIGVSEDYLKETLKESVLLPARIVYCDKKRDACSNEKENACTERIKIIIYANYYCIKFFVFDSTGKLILIKTINSKRISSIDVCKIISSRSPVTWDGEGHIISEAMPGGTFWKDYIYLDGRPLAMQDYFGW